MTVMGRRVGLWLITLLAVFAPWAGAQEILVSTEDLFFSYVPGGALPPSQTFSLSSGDEENEISFVASTTTGTWLRVTPTGGETPATLTVSVSPAGLAPGSYTDLITITGGQSAVTISVELFVASRANSLLAQPTFLTFTADADSEDRQSKILNISSAINEKTKFEIAYFGGGEWLTVQPTAGATTNPLLTPLPIEVTVDPTAVTSGVYNALIVVMDKDGKPGFFVPVTFTVTGTTPIEIDPSELSFSAALGSTAPQSENVLISSGSDEAINFTVAASTTSGGSWLRVSPTSGTTNTFVAVTVNPRDLEEGTYEGVIRITALGDVIELPVTLDVISGPLLVVTPEQLAFTVASGLIPSPQTISIRSETGDSLPFQVTTSGESWLNVTPRSGSTSAALSVSVNPQGLSPGSYNATVTVESPGSDTSWTVTVRLNITTLTLINTAPSQITWVTQEGDTDTFSQKLSLTSTQGKPAFTVLAAPADSWLSVSPTSGTLPAEITVTADPSELTEDTYTGSIVIVVQGADNSPMAVPVSFKVTPAEPVVGSILHAATLRPGILTAGTVVSIFGRGLGPKEGEGLQIGDDGKVTTELGGVTVLFNDIPAPLIYVQERQINAVIPYGVYGKRLTTVVVDYGGIQSEPINVQLFDSAPGIFTADSTGQGNAAIINDDGTFNSTTYRARHGRFITLFATGGGQTRPPSVDGTINQGTAPALLLPVKAFIGGKEAEVSYAAAAPGLISGMLQVNVRVPADAPSGLIPLVLSIGDFRSQPGVSVAVE